MLVGVLVPKNGGDVLPALVGERAVTDKRLLEGKREVGDLGHGARQLGELSERSVRKRLDA